MTLIKSIIPAVLSYSCEVRAGCPKYVFDNIEATHKKIIYSILNLPEKNKVFCSTIRMRDEQNETHNI